MSDSEDQNETWSEVQCCLRQKLKPYGLDGCKLFKWYIPHQQRLVELIKRTTFMGESNSVLIVGPRGSGKSALLQSVLEELQGNKSTKESLIHVALNGLVHTDDNIALKDIMRQLKLENMGDKVAGSFAEKLTILLEALKSGSKHNKSILFVLDEFDLFTTHRDQTLLYNLFDVAQSQQSPICVVGLTCSPDILTKLENRVKSRFSHQLIYLFDHIPFSEYVGITKELLSLPEDFSNVKFMETWNCNINEVLDQSVVKEVLKKYYTFGSNIRDLKRFLMHCVMFLNYERLMIESSDFVSAFSYFTKDVKLQILRGLSILELSLVITMMHLTEIYDREETFNFEIVFHEYKKFLQKKMSLQNLDKAVVLKALEHLMSIELVKPVNHISGNALKRYMPIRLMLEPEQIKDALKNYPNLPYQLQQWAVSGILD